MYRERDERSLFLFSLGEDEEEQTQSLSLFFLQNLSSSPGAYQTLQNPNFLLSKYKRIKVRIQNYRLKFNKTPIRLECFRVRKGLNPPPDLEFIVLLELIWVTFYCVDYKLVGGGGEKFEIFRWEKETTSRLKWRFQKSLMLRRRRRRGNSTSLVALWRLIKLMPLPSQPRWRLRLNIYNLRAQLGFRKFQNRNF